MSKIVVGLVLSLLLIILIAFCVLYSWTFTPHGRLDLDVAIVLKLTPERPSPGSIPVEEERQNMREMTARFYGAPEPMERLENRFIPGPAGDIPIRIYWPLRELGLPLLVFFHGGGFRLGDLDTHDVICRGLAKKSECIVVSADYSLAPVHPFPAAAEDAYAVLQWVAANADALGADSERIAVGGDSAGGNLAAVTAMQARDRGEPDLAYQLLIYPITNAVETETASMKDFSEGYFLTSKGVEYSLTQYLPNLSDRSNPYASPMLADEHSNLPSALVVTAEFDPLRDDGEAYAKKMADSGVETRIKRYEGVIHGFFGVAFLSKGRQALDETGEALREALRK